METPSGLINFDFFFFLVSQILVSVCLACAVAQPQNEFQAPSQAQRQQISNDQDQQNRFDARTSSTTWIPILSYNKEQGQDGSYRAA